MQIYCVKCKNKTTTTNPQKSVSQNGRYVVKGTCSKCGTKQQQFLAGKGVTKPKQAGGCGCDLKKGKGVVDKLLNSGKMPELHLRGFAGKYNFAGPGTKLNKRLDANKQPLPHSKPINRLDHTAYEHDLCYEKYKDGPQRRKICDTDMINSMDRIVADPKTGWKEKADTKFTRAVIKTKKFLGLGRKSQQQM